MVEKLLNYIKMVGRGVLIMINISIIIPVYNVQMYLNQCLDSILKQSYNFWEAFLIDDGSTDESGKICDMYQEKDSRFHVVHKENGGAASAKNIGLNMVTGDFVTFIDSDDYIESTLLEKVVNIIEKKNVDVVEFGFDKVFKDFIEDQNSNVFSYYEYSAEEYLRGYVIDWKSSLFWNKVFSVDLLGDIRFRKERRCIDDEFFTYKVVSRAEKIAKIEDVLYHYRQRISSTMLDEKNRKQITDDVLEMIIERFDWIAVYFPQLKLDYLKHDIDLLLHLGNFTFTDETIKKYRKATYYYFFHSLRYSTDTKLIINIVKLLFVKKRKLIKKEDKYRINDVEKYFR